LRNKENILGDGGTPFSGLDGEAPPERGALFKLAICERVTKLAAK